MNTQKQTDTNIYWRDIDAARDEIKDNGASYSSNGRMIYWHGHEASEAQNWLADEAQIQRRKTEQRDTAQPKRERPKKNHSYRCPVCFNEVEANDNSAMAQSMINGANKLAHAERLAEALEIVLPWLVKANGSSVFENCALPLGGVQAEKQIRSALNDWKAAQ